jgi:hypothetical protein
VREVATWIFAAWEANVQPDISADQRARAKAAATVPADASNDAAVVLGASAALVAGIGVGSGLPPLAGVVPEASSQFAALAPG